MVPKRRQDAIRQLDGGSIVSRRCGVCDRPTRITYIDIDSGIGVGRCCIRDLKRADDLILAIGKSIGWDIFSTWEHPSFGRREQNAIKFRANKPFNLD